MTRITLKNGEIIETNDSLSIIIQYATQIGFIANNILKIIEIDGTKKLVKIDDIKSIEVN